MIDFHSHLLYALDDGPKSLDESVEITGSYISQRIFDVVCTPHFYADKTSMEDFTQLRDARLKELRRACTGSNGFRMYAGAEVYCDGFLEICQDISPLCIQGTDLLLVEMPLYTRKWPEEVWCIIDKTINRHGLNIIIAHAERYVPVLRHPKSILSRLIDMGCTIQVNCDAFLVKSTRSAVLKWVDKGYVHIIATDCHNNNNRPPRMLEALKVISDNCGEDKAARLINNAETLLAGKTLGPNKLVF